MLDTGTAAARGDLLAMMDGDTVFEPDTVAHLVQPFADPSVGAVSGNAKAGNRKGSWDAGCMPTVLGGPARSDWAFLAVQVVTALYAFVPREESGRDPAGASVAGQQGV